MGTFSRRLLTLRPAGAGRFGARHLRSKRFSPKGRLLRIYLFFNHKQNNFQQQSNVKHVYPVSGPGI